ncbi:T-cell surface antigen CD2-like isoform X2 [Trachemys scripta elegans]|uniref:T-cell surface antigen CD2-like isoform X2 n=1 Tax=Trachemys scripta elegans TaxID=31138 RepID=UPI001555B11F|nr:T-cell surface antigen CD2-like isoform X2 [Trachemys scripta elegans]
MILKMKFREIFLAKCLVVLFSCVKGSADKDPKVYGIQNSSVFLNIPDFKVEKQHEIIWLKNSIHLTKGKGSNVKYYKDRKKYEMFTNGTLKIDCLVEEDSGNYKVAVYSATGRLQVEKNLLLSIQEIVSKPEIKWICSQKLIKVICEVKQKNKPALYLLQNNRTLSVNGPIYTNGTWKIEYPPKARILTAKFQCEVKNDVSKRTDDQEIKCSDDETPMQIQQVDDELKYRELSQSLVHAPQKQPCQQQRPPPQSQTQYQVVPPQPRPRTQLKSPRHMKKRP